MAAMDNKTAEKILDRVDDLRENLGGNLKELQSALDRLSIEVEQIKDDTEDYDRELRSFRDRFNKIEKKMAKLPPDELKDRINEIESLLNNLPKPRRLSDDLDNIRQSISEAKKADPANLQMRVEKIENKNIVTLNQLRMYVGMIGILVMILGALDFFAA